MTNSHNGFKHVTLAMDLSLNGPGFAVIAVEPTSNKPIILDVRSLVLTRHKAHGPKLQATTELLRNLLTTYKPQHLVREKGFSRFPATTQSLFKVVGATELTAYNEGYEVITEIAPTSVKKAVTGNGKASKEDVASAVVKHLQIEDVDYFANDDETDAAAVGLAYLKSIKAVKL